MPASSAMSSNGRERGTTSQGVRDRRGVLVRSQALAEHLLDRPPPGLRHRGQVVGPHEPLHTVFPQRSCQRVPAGERPGHLRRGRVIGRRDQAQRGHAPGIEQGMTDGGMRAHRRARQHRALDAEGVQHRA